MRYLILSDLHGNWEALFAVLQTAEGKYDKVLCCGDIVGYGADPNPVTNWVRTNSHLTIRGNHDRACSSLEGIDWFNPLAQSATRWTNQALSEENRSWLHDLPQGPAKMDGFEIVHGSPINEDDYLLSIGEATEAFASIDTGLTFFGHTHIQGGFEQRRMKTRRWDRNRLDMPVTLDESSAYLINPGSVGQPRDRDWRAAFALFDGSTRTLRLARAEYDVEASQRKILEAGLPTALAARLGVGC